MGEAAGRPELAVADAVDPASTCSRTVSAIAGVTSAAMAAGSVSSALASRAGMSSHPLGGGSRPEKRKMSFSPNQNPGPLTPYNAAPRGLASDIARLLGCATFGSAEARCERPLSIILSGHPALCLP